MSSDTNLQQITISSFNLDLLKEKLRVFGVAIVKNYLSSEQLQGIKDEIKHIDSFPACISQKHKHPNNDGLVIRLKPDKFLEQQRFIKSAFVNQQLLDIARMYFKSDDVDLNDEIFYTHELPDVKPILPWHFDRRQSLKFYINLEDVDASNGAFEYCLKSHREGNLRANYHVFKGVPIHEIPNDVPDDELYNETTIVAKAGDLIIFDAAGFHRGGIIQEGKERFVIRGHSHPGGAHKYGKAARFSPEWIARSKLNVIKHIGDRIQRKACISDSLSVLTRKIEKDN